MGGHGDGYGPGGKYGDGHGYGPGGKHGKYGKHGGKHGKYGKHGGKYGANGMYGRMGGHGSGYKSLAELQRDNEIMNFEMDQLFKFNKMSNGIKSGIKTYQNSRKKLWLEKRT